MSWRLTFKERRIIERTRREGEQSESPAQGGPGALWRSVLAWAGGILILILFAMFIVWVGTLLG